MVGPDDGGHANVMEVLRRHAGVGGGHDDDGARGGVRVPLVHEGLDVRGVLELAVAQDGVGAVVLVYQRALHRVLQAQAGDEGLETGDDHEVLPLLGLLAGLDLEAELHLVGQRLLLAVHEGVGLGEHLVLEAHTPDAGLLQVAHQAARVVEVAEARVAV